MTTVFFCLQERIFVIAGATIGRSFEELLQSIFTLNFLYTDDRDNRKNTSLYKVLRRVLSRLL